MGALGGSISTKTDAMYFLEAMQRSTNTYDFNDIADGLKTVNSEAYEYIMKHSLNQWATTLQPPRQHHKPRCGGLFGTISVQTREGGVYTLVRDMLAKESRRLYASLAFRPVSSSIHDTVRGEARTFASCSSARKVRATASVSARHGDHNHSGIVLLIQYYY